MHHGRDRICPCLLLTVAKWPSLMAKATPPPQPASSSSTENPLVWQGITSYISLGLTGYFLISLAESKTASKVGEIPRGAHKVREKSYSLSASSHSCSARGDPGLPGAAGPAGPVLPRCAHYRAMPPLHYPIWDHRGTGTNQCPSGVGCRFCSELWVSAPLFPSLPFHCAWLAAPLATGHSYFS